MTALPKQETKCLQPVVIAAATDIINKLRLSCLRDLQSVLDDAGRCAALYVRVSGSEQLLKTSAAVVLRSINGVHTACTWPASCCWVQDWGQLPATAQAMGLLTSV